MGDRVMEHAEKVRHLEELRQLRRLGATVIYPVANQQGCATAPLAFAQIPERVVLQTQDFYRKESRPHEPLSVAGARIEQS
jgi:hypothetical protein